MLSTVASLTSDAGEEQVDLYDPAYIYRSIFGSKMKGHRQTWPLIDLSELQSINPDCVGWIHIDGCPVNYPVVKQHFDRSYYLTHNFSGEESVHGQVCLDFRHGGRMGNRTTVLHAHHMKDWSMFKAIVSLEEADYLATHPTVELVHGDKRYTARWSASVLYRSDDPWPERIRFADDADYAAWLARVALESTMPVPFAAAVDARLIVCDTCAYFHEPFDKFAAFAVIEGESLHKASAGAITNLSSD